MHWYILKCSNLPFSRLKIHQIKILSNQFLPNTHHLKSMCKMIWEKSTLAFQINLTTNKLYVLKEKSILHFSLKFVDIQMSKSEFQIQLIKTVVYFYLKIGNSR